MFARQTGLIYIEYISRRPGVALRRFHADVQAGQKGWEREHPEDRLLWSAAKTWRLGPGPGYIGVWWSPGAGLGRLDYWERVFKSVAAGGGEDLFQQVAVIEAAGCYEALIEPRVAGGGTYYAEFFRPTGTQAAICELFQERAGKHRSFTLNLVATRVGKLAPEPGGIAIWTVPDFGSIVDFATELDGVVEPIELATAGTYADVGQEVL